MAELETRQGIGVSPGTVISVSRTVFQSELQNTWSSNTST